MAMRQLTGASSTWLMLISLGVGAALVGYAFDSTIQGEVQVQLFCTSPLSLPVWLFCMQHVTQQGSLYLTPAPGSCLGLFGPSGVLCLQLWRCLWGGT
jgi:hypothetical protein